MSSPTRLPLSAVRLRAGAYRDAADRGLRTVLALDPDRLLAPYRREAGLPMDAPTFGGWESDGLDGHILGHALSALAAHAASGSAAASTRLAEIVSGLRECQTAVGTGYVGGVPDGAALWDELTDGRVEADTFHLNGRWVPLYNLHKVLTGLLDAVDIAGDPGAAIVLDDAVGWWVRTLNGLAAGVHEEILRTEFGGMTATFARLATLRADAGLLDVARALAHRSLLDPLASGRDELDGLHANTQIPVVVGYAEIALAARTLGGDGETFARAARTFWRSVAGRRSVAIGGCSVREHFHAASDFSTMFSAREGPETCNTANMVQLALTLHRLDGDDELLAFVERASANHLLSAQHPEHGGFVYFTSQRPGHYRIASGEDSGFWCCVGTGLEMHARHGAAVFSTTDDEIRIDLIAAAEATVHGMRIAIDTDAPFADTATVTVTASEPVAATLAILVPAGVDTAATATVDGGVHRAGPGERLRVSRTWDGTVAIDLDLPPRLRVEQAPDGSAWGWIVDGPRVLANRIPDPDVDYRAPATRMGHIARGPLRALADAPVIDPALGGAVRVAPGRVRIGALELEPFARLHDARYVVSFPLAAPDAVTTRRAELAVVDAAALSTDARTRDAVAFGEQQPESDHGVVWTPGTKTGVTGDRRWRRTAGSASVLLRDWTATARTLVLDWNGRGAVRILLADEEVGFLEGTDAGGSADFDLGPWADGRIDWPLRLEAVGGETPLLHRLALLSDAADS